MILESCRPDKVLKTDNRDRMRDKQVGGHKSQHAEAYDIGHYNYLPLFLYDV